MSSSFDSLNCIVCLSTLDSASHLLFDCPTKEKIWQGAIFEFLWPTTPISDIKEALLSLDFSNLRYCQVKGIRPLRILAIALSQIWLVHMRLVFDKVVIVPEDDMKKEGKEGERNQRHLSGILLIVWTVSHLGVLKVLSNQQTLKAPSSSNPKRPHHEQYRNRY